MGRRHRRTPPGGDGPTGQLTRCADPVLTLQRCRAAGAVIRARVGPCADTALAAVDVAAIVYAVRCAFARHHILPEACRHLLDTLRGRAFPPTLDDDIADQALVRHSRQLTVPLTGDPVHRRHYRRRQRESRWLSMASFISRNSDCRPVPESVVDQSARECRREMTALSSPWTRDGHPPVSGWPSRQVATGV